MSIETGVRRCEKEYVHYPARREWEDKARWDIVRPGRQNINLLT